MPFYHRLDTSQPDDRRTVERLLTLRQGLRENVPPRTLRETLLLATWNIRDFDKASFGGRLEESYYYIAEVISSFDLVAVQEVYKDLGAFERVLDILGSHWGYLFTDETSGDQGNDERLAFVYDKRKVRFGGLAGELVLPGIRDADGEMQPVTQIARTPMVVGLKAGWTKFMLCTVHILWGDGDADNPRRVAEIHNAAQALKARTEDESAWARNLIMLGDFNIFGTDDDTFQEILDAGFVVPPELLEFRSNATQTRHYDQIAFRVREDSLEPTGNAGVFDFYDYVFRNTPEDRDLYAPFMRATIDSANADKPPSRQSTRYDDRDEGGRTLYYRTYWRTHQMSDHLPMWVELRIDYSDEYLQYKLDND